MKNVYNLLIVGGTGLVGRELIEILLKKGFPFSEIKISNSTLEKGNIEILNRDFQVYPLNEEVFEDVDICFFCSTSEVSEKWCIYAKEKCKYVIDNSSFFRMRDNVPLIIPEINLIDINNRLISNPNCSTIQSLLVLNEIRKEYRLNKVIYSTYQSCSGGGKSELEELNNSRLKISNIYDHYLCDTCISQIGSIDEEGYSQEELKMINETKKILKLPFLEVHANCIRVPVNYCHGVFIYVEVDKEVSKNKVIDLIKGSNRLEFIEDNKIIYFQKACKSEKVLVGRVKVDKYKKNCFSLFCVADNLYVGAAYNAYHIALNLIGEKNEKN